MLARDLYPEAWQQAIAMLQRNPQALLISGREGLGKSGLALELTHWLLCESVYQHTKALDISTIPEVCGHCTSCQLMIERQHPDFRWIMPGYKWSDLLPWWTNKKPPDFEPTHHIRIEDIQSLSDFTHLSAARAGRRVVVIWPAQAMNRHAANALLKTLEEPERDLIFLLVTDRKERLPSTILSRCRELVVSPPPLHLAQRWITAQHTQNSASAQTNDLPHTTIGPHTATAAAIPMILSLAAGAPMRALRWLPHHPLLEEVARAISQTNGSTMMALAERMDASVKRKASSHTSKPPPKTKRRKETTDPTQMKKPITSAQDNTILNLDDWLDILQRLLTNRLCHQLQLPCPYVDDDTINTIGMPSIAPLSTNIPSPDQFFQLMDEIVYFRQHIIFTLNPRQVFEKILLQLAQLNQNLQ